jgi:hypothetical protein
MFAINQDRPRTGSNKGMAKESSLLTHRVVMIPARRPSLHELCISGGQESPSHCAGRYL